MASEYVPPDRINVRLDTELRELLRELSRRMGTTNTSHIVRSAIALAQDRMRTVPEVLTQHAVREGWRAGFAKLKELLGRSLDTFMQGTGGEDG